MKSIFLKLSSFRFGAARRHCPFTSIIHKHISIFLALVFFLSYVLLVPVSVEASSLPSGFKPYIRPVYNTTIEDFQSAYSELSGDSLTIFLIIAGAYVLNYAGLGDFGLVFEDPPQDATIKERLQFFGQQLVDTIFLPQNLFNSVFDPILSYLQGAVTKAKNTTMSEFEVDLGGGGSGTSFGVLLPSNADLIMSFNQFYYRYKGLYQWQFDSKPFSNLSYKSDVLDGASSIVYSQYLSSLVPLHFRANAINDTFYYNVRFGNMVECSLFYNTSDGYCYLADSNGDILNTIDCDIVYYNEYSGAGNGIGFKIYFNRINFSSYSLPFAQLTNLLFTNDTSTPYLAYVYGAGKRFIPLYNDFVKHVYVGDSWGNRQEIFNLSDLGISNTVSNNLEVPKAPTLLDLSAVIEALQGLGTNINDLRSVITDNSYLANTGQIVVQNDFDLSTLSELIPDSGIVVPEGLFGSSKGFIDYLWYMTKPLVQYTHDFLGTMWFDGVDGFDFSGPAPIVFGVITLGLIGGLIVKFLL